MVYITTAQNKLTGSCIMNFSNAKQEIQVWADEQSQHSMDQADTETRFAPEGLTMAMNLLWEAQSERTDRLERAHAEARELLMRR